MSIAPRYEQVKEYIRQRVASGELRPADRVPSENELVALLDVSRMTANRALRELTDEGLLIRRAGIGTFVAELKAVSHVLEVHSIAEEIAARGHRHSTRVIVQCQQAAADEVARGLGLAPGRPVYYTRLVHLENRVPIQVEDRFVDAAFATDWMDQDFEKVTPSEYLTRIAPLQKAEQVVRAVIADDELLKLLEMEQQEPCLLVIRRTWAGGRPVSFSNLYHPGNRFELSGRYRPTTTEASWQPLAGAVTRGA